MFRFKKIVTVTFLLMTSLCASNITLTGTVVSDGQKMIGSRYMGYVKKVYVKLGDKVKREDDLYEMESAEFDIMKTQANLMLEQSQIALEYWRDRLHAINKKKENVKKKFGMMGFDWDDLESQVENIKAMFESTKIMVKHAAEQVKQMAVVFNYLKMKAPADGVVVQKNIKVGDMVMPGMLTIMIVDTEHLEIDVSLSEGIIGKVREGMKLAVEIPSIKYRTVGRIKAIIPDANPMTHKIKMRVSFDKGNKNIFPGMYAKVVIPNKN
ncbi:Probable Co/Zn/Cd efflux system membrane fusion protein [hydrothermal vent metagenome]|uniref:Probable Co/Zn/Cd efflux system membrane fusion protein n=1 Tax=hydrothermal vent metagenome TaxID=652676 RepID=A0A1W1BPD9_9ZZZZ